MGTSSFIFAGRVQADPSFARFAEFLSASSWSALWCIPPETTMHWRWTGKRLWVNWYVGWN